MLPTIITLPTTKDSRGILSFLEEDTHIPFPIKRVYYLYDIPEDQSRGGHALKALSQVMIAVNGSFDIILDDGQEKQKITLNRPDQGLLILPGIWRELTNFSSNAICLVLASHKYNSSDYIRDYADFLAFKKANP